MSAGSMALATARKEALNAIERQISSAPRRYATPEGQVALGRFFLLRGADPKKVLDQFYDVAIKRAPRFRRRLPRHGRAGPREAGLRPGGRDAPQGAQGRRPRTRGSTTCWPAPSPTTTAPARPRRWPRRSKINPRHVDSLLLQADQLIDSERYAEAEKVLDQVLDGQPARAAGLGLPRGAGPPSRTTATAKPRRARTALARWAVEPRGRSPDRPQARRRSTASPRGPPYQRRALELDPDYLPAKVQLCQDLLRLGEEDGGLEARRRDLRHGWLQRGRLQPGHPPRPPGRLPHARGRRLPRADGPARGRPLRPPRARRCCGGPGRRCARSTG